MEAENMRKILVVVVCLCLLGAASSTQAFTPRADRFLNTKQVVAKEMDGDKPLTTANTFSRADTICFGGHDGNGYAVEGGIWDFSDGTMQGWYGIDMTQNSGQYWWARYRAIDYECPASAPMTNASSGHLWCGGEQSDADAGCWTCDAGLDCALGYPNSLCQRATAPLIPYTTGDISINFQYYTDSEGLTFDYTKVQILAYDGSILIEAMDVDDLGGINGLPGSPVTFSSEIYDFNIPEGTDGLKLRFEFVSDTFWSDEDGLYCSTYGAIGLDNVTLASDAGSTTYDWESDSEGFVYEHCPGVGNWIAINPIDNYLILDPCACELSNYVLAFHDDNLTHGDPGAENSQWNMAVSPIIDRSAYPAPDYNSIFARWDIYSWLPLENGVLYRPGWFYYPWECTETGSLGWSPRSGDDDYLYVGTDPICYESNDNATENEVPGGATYYRFCIEVKACCTCFGITNCTGASNETPLIDNIQVCVTGIPDAPVADYGNGCYYQDGFGQSMFIDPTATGRCDSWDVGAGTAPPFTLSDSLSISGPPVLGTTPSWEAKLWFKLPRVGPAINQTAYNAWKSRLPGDPELGFVAVRMDSCQTIMPFSNKFCSYFHESEAGFNMAFNDLTDENEILPDDLFTPGTLIQYFVTTNYIGNPQFAFVEDTTNGFFREIEILPSMRVDPVAEEIVWPCVLYVDAYNRGAENFIQPALDYFLQEVPGVGPNNDRYDEDGASTNYNGSSLYRTGNNGATLPQLLAYSGIIVNSGLFSGGALEETDFIGLEDWLLTSICDQSEVRQGLILNGDEMALIIQEHRPSFLFGALGTGLDCSPYRDAGCPSGTPEDTSFCIQVIDVDMPVFPSSTDYWAYGNGCPNIYTYSVLFPQGTGQGNRSWFDFDFSGPKGVVEFAQIVNEDLGLNNYRTSVEGYSYHHITSSFAGGTCVPDSAGIVSAVASELVGTLNWLFDGPPPAFCTDPCGITDDVPDVDGVEVKINRLYQNRPNPFNPRTVISFAIAQRSDVELAIYDVSGRLVRQLKKGVMDAGLQNIVWDGTDDTGRNVSSGIYWSQLTIGEYRSNKKMVLLK